MKNLKDIKGIFSKKGMRVLFLSLMMGIIAFLLFSCCNRDLPEHLKNETFRYRWYRYYQMGLDDLYGTEEKKEVNYEGAVKNFQMAIYQNNYKGKEDQWSVNTFAMNYIDYFPHREMGIALYWQGKFEEAREFLELSISQTPTEKALVYLERSYEALVKQKNIEVSKPNIFITGKERSNDSIIISGIVGDNKYIKEIRVNDEPVFLLNTKEDLEKIPDENQISKLSKEEQKNLRDLEKKIYFIKQLPILHGMQQTITVKAQNVMGKDSIIPKDVTIDIDKSGPVIAVNFYDNDTIIGSIKDDSKVSGFFINEKKISSIPKDKRGFTFAVTYKNGTIIGSIKDDSKEVPFNEIVKVNTDKLELVAYDEFGNKTEMISDFKPINDTYPVITVKNLSSNQKVYVKSETLSLYKLELNIAGNNEIKAVQINNDNIIHEQKGKFISLNYEINLQEDTCIRATDEKNNTTIQEIRGINNKTKKSEEKEVKNDGIWIASRDMSNIILTNNVTDTTKTQPVIKETESIVADPFSLKNRLGFVVLPFYFYLNETLIPIYSYNNEEISRQFQSLLKDSIINSKRFNVIENSSDLNSPVKINEVDEKGIKEKMIKVSSPENEARFCIIGEIIQNSIPSLPENLTNNLREDLYRDKIDVIYSLIFKDESAILYKDTILEILNNPRLTERSDYYFDGESLKNLEKQVGSSNPIIGLLKNLLEEESRSEIYKTGQEVEIALEFIIKNDEDMTHIITTDEEYKEYKNKIFSCLKSKYRLNIPDTFQDNDFDIEKLRPHNLKIYEDKDTLIKDLKIEDTDLGIYPMSVLIERLDYYFNKESLNKLKEIIGKSNPIVNNLGNLLKRIKINNINVMNRTEDFEKAIEEKARENRISVDCKDKILSCAKSKYRIKKEMVKRNLSTGREIKVKILDTNDNYPMEVGNIILNAYKEKEFFYISKKSPEKSIASLLKIKFPFIYDQKIIRHGQEIITNIPLNINLIKNSPLIPYDNTSAEYKIVKGVNVIVTRIPNAKLDHTITDNLTNKYLVTK